MITIQVSQIELGNIIKALENRKKKKQKRIESWLRKKEVGLIIPLEIADHFIEIDTHTAELITPLIERLDLLQIAV